MVRCQQMCCDDADVNLRVWLVLARLIREPGYWNSIGFAHDDTAATLVDAAYFTQQPHLLQAQCNYGLAQFCTFRIGMRHPLQPLSTISVFQ